MSRTLQETLQNTIEGEVRSDATTRRAYSVDASIYEIEPLFVVSPRHTEDILQTIRTAAEYGVPIIPRGAATGITGGCLGEGIVLDMSMHLNKILEINVDKGYAICQPGVVQDALNDALAPLGYRLGPDTSTGNRATIGGMAANNSAGAHSLVYGQMSDHMLEAQVALSDGSLVTLKELSDECLQSTASEETPLGRLCREIGRIRNEYRQDIVAHFPKLPRRVSGYNLDALATPGPLNMAKLIAGSEGTLGIITKIKVRIVPLLGKTAVCVVHFATMEEAMASVEKMLAYKPISLEMIDRRILEASKGLPGASSRLGWLQGDPEAVIVAEFETPDLDAKIDVFRSGMQQLGLCYAATAATSEDARHIWEVRKGGLGLLLSKRTYSRAIAFIEDLSIPPSGLASFMKAFREYLKACGKEAGIYGHVGAGCMHIRPYIDLRKPEELRLMHQMMLDISVLVARHGGALSGEHGDGLIRSWLNEQMFGPRLYEAFCALKAAFDPSNRMNPGKIVHSPPLLNNLRLSPETPITQIETFQDFSAEGGFSLAADLCNGNAQCRKREGVMCPSFQATGNEFDTTRARAQALRAVINGRWKIDDFTSDKVGRVMDLCLECKGCKSECPSHVDMAKMKAEFLFHYQEKHGYTLRSRIFAHIGALFAFAYPFKHVFNRLSNSRIFKKAAAAIGIAADRSLPALADERFSAWAQRQPNEEGTPVVLFVDTFTEFNQPSVGIAAFTVLRRLGFQVIVPPWTCCGRTMISKGFLKDARKKAVQVVRLLAPYAAEGIPIVGLEPSCILTIADDLPAIVDADMREQAKLVATQCQTFDGFIGHCLTEGRLPLLLNERAQVIYVHGHCHQKSLVGMKAALEVLKAIPGSEVHEIPSGCCGMAGSFGYEAEHAALSKKIGQLHLFPAIESAPPGTLFVADGFSCRSQIEQCTGRKAVHLAEALLQSIKNK